MRVAIHIDDQRMLLKFVAYCAVLSTVCAKPKKLADNDGYHPYYLPDSAPDMNDPETWRDYINDPDDIIKEDWMQLGQDELEDALLRTANPIIKPAKNVIMFVGDGMGISTVTGARIYMSQQRNLTGRDTYLSFEKMPYVGLSRTYATDQMTPDSANTATAMFSGEKCRDGVILANQNVVRSNCSSLKGNELTSVLHKAIQAGKVAGIVSTPRITHATPACTYANAADRDWEADSNLDEEDRYVCEDIASQLVRLERNQNIKVVLGGGRRNFFMFNESDPEYPNENGRRLDRNLIEEWRNLRMEAGLSENQYSVVYNQSDFDAIDVDETEYLLGLFETGHMNYEMDREDPDYNNWAEPSIAEMTEKAIKILEKNENGFFLMVEGGRIDHAHHENRAIKSMGDTVAFQDAIAKAVEMTQEDETLMVVTADHSHVFTIAGYGANNADVRTYDDRLKPMNGGDGKPYTTFSYGNGPGYDLHRRDENGTEIPRINLADIDKDILTDKDWVFDAGVPRSSETHAGEDVGIWAKGPMAHLYHGSHEQSYIAHAVMYAMCVGPRDDLCRDVSTVPPTPGRASILGGSSYLVLPVMIVMLIKYCMTN